MAEIITDLKQLKPRTAPFPPGLKPPVESFEPQDAEDPQEAEEFRAYIRELRRQGEPDPA